MIVSNLGLFWKLLITMTYMFLSVYFHAFLLAVYLVLELQGPKVDSTSVGNAKLFSWVIVPIYNHAGGIRKLSLLCVLTSCCFYQSYSVISWMRYVIIACISPINNDIEPIFTCLVVILDIFVTCPILINFFLLIWRNVLYIYC